MAPARYLLVVVQLRVPPLRERRADLRSLVQHFLRKYGLRIGKIATLDAEVYEYLEAYHWPGNVRELENLVQRALAMTEESELTVEDFTFDIEEPLAATVTMPLSDTACWRDDRTDEEQRQLVDALHKCDGNQTKAAKLLGGMSPDSR